MRLTGTKSCNNPPQVNMEIGKDRFFAAGVDLKISEGQLEALWIALEKEKSVSDSPLSATYLFYLGALIAIAAMTAFMNVGWEKFGGGGMALIALLYAILLTTIGRWLWRQQGFRTPAGLLVTIAVCMVPLVIYGLETHFGIWPSPPHGQYQDFYHFVDGSWIFIDLGTLLVGSVALAYFPFPFLTAPIFCAGWFLAMDMAPFILGREVRWPEPCWISLCFGLFSLAIGIMVDRKQKPAYGFWAYFFGTLSFWGGVSCLAWERGEWALFLFLLVNVSLITLSIVLRRTVLAVFGAIGLFLYLSHLAYNLFADAILFPFALSFIGLGIVYLGVWYQRKVKAIEAYLHSIFNKFNG